MSGDFQKETIVPTNKFQTEIRKNINLYKLVFPTAKDGNILT
jgi:hypothetical protein